MFSVGLFPSRHSLRPALCLLALAGLCMPAPTAAQVRPTAATLLAASQTPPPVRPAGPCASLSDSLPADAMDAAIKDAWSLLDADDFTAGLACFERVLAAADQQQLPAMRAEALLGAGQAQRQLGRYQEAKARHDLALPIFRELGDRAGEARALRNLGLDAYYLGKEPEARTALFAAKALFEQLQDRKALVTVYNNLMYVVDAGPEKDRLRAEALEAARNSGKAAAECSILHEWGDEFYSKGWYADAKDKLTEALSCYERTTDLVGTGTVLVSMGRMSRTHGRPDLAMVYYTRALELQERSGDTLSTVQTLNAMAISLALLGHMDESLAKYEEALARARAVGSDQVAAFLEGQIGGHYLGAGEVERAIPLLESSLRRDPRHVMHRERQLADAYARVGRTAEALPLADHAVELARGTGTTELLSALMSRENVHYYAGQVKEAEADLTEAFSIIEDQRTRLVPSDFMKRGFVAVTQAAYGVSIDLLQRSGRALEALERAEQARARAFIDLLASRTPPPPAATPDSSGTETKNETRKKPETTVARAAATALPKTGRGGLTARGTGESAGRDTRTGRSAGGGTLTREIEAELTSNAVASHEAVAAPTLADVRATARRLGSTLLVYWVGPERTSIWVVSPAGRVRSAYVKVTASRLRDLVSSAGASIEQAVSGLGSRAQTRPWRELYDVLIAPVRAYLPTAPNSLLTVVPHGPLFQVSFAALQDERGTYLLERYRLHYTPAIGVLEFTGAREYASLAKGGEALLIGDPDPLVQERGEDPMPPLPWAKREVDEIGRLLTPVRADILTRNEAKESAIRGRIEQADVIHFATHGVVEPEEALGSFLALSDPRARESLTNADDPPKPRAKTDDGRLTADEVYALHLRARLVVLSACRTALGPLSGDGVIGFTRAFLYAGAASVIATSWDVPDEAGYEVMKRFYAAHPMGANGARTGATRPATLHASNEQTAAALRTAQLAVLHSLRKGTFTVSTSAGPVAVPEHPLFWAGFLVVGEP